MRRDLAGRAVLIAAGVGTALGAGAGLANAAPLEQDLQQDQSGQNAFDQASTEQSSPADALTGSLPMAPGLDALPTKTQAASPLDIASADQLAGLGGLLGGGAESASPAESAGGASDSASGSTESASPSTSSGSTESATSPSSSGSSSSGSTESASPSTTGSSSSPSASSSDSAAPSSTGSGSSSSAPTSGGTESGGTTYYGGA